MFTANAPATHLKVRVRRLEHACGLELPERASAGSAGMDLRAACSARIDVAPGERVIVPTGWVMEIPPGWEGQVRPRSGLAFKSGLTVINAPGTIDSDYRGEVGVLLINLGAKLVSIQRGDRVAQIVFSAVPEVEWVEIGASDAVETGRAAGGFGSTGTR